MLLYKVGCVFPMVIWPEFRMGQYRDDDHRDHAPLFISWLENKIIFGSYDRETEGYSIAHCYLPAGQEFEFPDIFLRNSTKDDFMTENMKDTILTGYNKSYASETYRKRFNFNHIT